MVYQNEHELLWLIYSSFRLNLTFKNIKVVQLSWCTLYRYLHWTKIRL